MNQGITAEHCPFGMASVHRKPEDREEKMRVHPPRSLVESAGVSRNDKVSLKINTKNTRQGKCFRLMFLKIRF